MLDSELSEILELVIGTEENRVHTHHHLGDSQVGDAREGFLAETEEVQVGNVTEVQELEVVLPVLVGQLDEAVIVSHHLGGGVNTSTAGDDLNVNHVWKRFEVDGVHLFDGCKNLLLPVFEQGVPVLEVVACTLHEVRNAVTDELRCNCNRAHVAETVVNTEFNTVCWRDDVVAGVVCTEATYGEFHTDGLKWLEHVGPVLRVAEPELRVFLVFQVFLEYKVVWVEVLPTFSALGCWQVIRRDEALTSSARRHCFCLLSEHVVVPFSSSRLVLQGCGAGVAVVVGLYLRSPIWAISDFVIASIPEPVEVIFTSCFFCDHTVSGRLCRRRTLEPAGRSASIAHSMS